MRLGGTVAAAALLVAVPAMAAPAQPPASLRAQIEALEALDARVQSVGWRLARDNATYCREAAPAIGLALFDAAGFADPAAVRTALGLSGDIAVGAIAAGSPAALAGLRPLQALRAVAGQDAAALPAVKPNDFARLVALHDRVDAALRATSQISFNDSSGVEIVVTGQLACVTRFELASSGSQAQADGLRVVIGRKLVEALPADDLLAAALAHELAHNLLGHRARLAREGRTWGRIKTTEREADRLSVWLLFNAGYDPHAAVRFFELWGPKFDLGLFATPDHDGWKARARLVEHEIAQVEAVRRSDGKVDWRAAFGEDASTRP